MPEMRRRPLPEELPNPARHQGVHHKHREQGMLTCSSVWVSYNTSQINQRCILYYLVILWKDVIFAIQHQRFNISDII